MQISRKARAALCALLSAVVIVVFWPGASGPFVFDDYPNIVTNPFVQPDELNAETLARAARGYQAGHIGRPLATVGFAIDYSLSGKDPIAFKAHNILLHALNTCLVFLLTLRLLSLPRAGWPNPFPAAAALALLWAIHPLQVSTVLYVVQRMEMLWVSFVLLALLAYPRGRVHQIEGRRGWPWLAGSALLAALGLLGKESAVLFPLFALALELTLLRFGAAAVGTGKKLRIAYVLGVIAGIALFLALLPGYLAPEAYSFRDFTLSERLLTQLRVLPAYLGQVVFPLPRTMGFYYDDLAISTSLLAPPSTLFGGLLVAALLAIAIGGRTRWPLVSLGLLWFFGAHALTSNVLPLEMAYEHRNYFALLGVLLAAAAVVRRATEGDAARLRPVLFSAIALFLGFLCFLRSSTWGDELHLATELVALNPESPRASNDLATLYIGYSGGDRDNPFFQFGMREFERGMSLPNASSLPEQGLIISAASVGMPVPDAWWESLMHKTRTRPIGPQESMAIMGLVRQRAAGTVLDDRRLAEAYVALSQRAPLFASYYARFGDHAINRLGDPVLAEEMFRKAVDASEPGSGYPAQLVRVLASEGHGGLAASLATYAEARGFDLR